MKFLKALILFSLLIVFSCGSDISYEQQVKKYNFHIKKSDSLIEKENYREAMRYINSAIEITDTISSAIYLKGFVSYKLNYLEDAEDNFSKVIEIEGEMSKTYKDRAKVYLKMDDSDFLEDINDYLKFYPDDEEAHALKKSYFEDIQDYENIISEYNLEIDKHQDSIELYVSRSNFYYLNGDYDEALLDYDKILSLDSNNTIAIKAKSKILNKINRKNNIIILIILLGAFYIIYVIISFFILKPFILKKATNQIGGEFTVSKDPLILVLPILLLVAFVVLYFIDFIPNFK